MDEFQVFRTVLGIDSVLMKIRIVCLPFLENRFGRIPLRKITQLLVIGEEVNRIQPAYWIISNGLKVIPNGSG